MDKKVKSFFQKCILFTDKKNFSWISFELTKKDPFWDTNYFISVCPIYFMRLSLKIHQNFFFEINRYIWIINSTIQLKKLINKFSYPDRVNVSHEHALENFWQVSQVKCVMTLCGCGQELRASYLVNVYTRIHNVKRTFRNFFVGFFEKKIIY